MVAAYPGGIFEQKVLLPMANHILSIVGWGRDATHGDYWLLRNSWGTYWGENGFAKIMMHKDNLGIENSCSYASDGDCDVSSCLGRTPFTASELSPSATASTSCS